MKRLLEDRYQQDIGGIRGLEGCKRIFDALPVELVIFDAQLRHVYINPISVVDEEVRRWMIGKTDLEYCLHRNKSSEFTNLRQKLFSTVLRTRRPYSIYQSGTNRHGEIQHHIRRLTPVYKQNGELEMLIGYGLDISNIKQKEAELKEKNSILEKTSRELDHFVYRTSHDLRSPLASIMGLTNLINYESPSLNILEYVGMIRNRTNKLDLVLRDIAAFAENSRKPIKRLKTDPIQLVESCIADMPFEFSKLVRGIECKIEGEEEWLTDRFRVKLILKHLLHNALKYHKRGQQDQHKVHLHLTILEEEVTIEIEDNGVGIAPEYHQQIFELFFRGQYKSSGSGIGLYIVQEVVDRLNGEIKIESAPVWGTRFKVKLPVLNPECPNTVLESDILAIDANMKHQEYQRHHQQDRRREEKDMAQRPSPTQ